MRIIKTFWKFTASMSWIIPCAGMALILLMPGEAIRAAGDGLVICASAIIPSLFPFLVFSSLAINTGFAQASSRLFEPFMRPVFNLSGSCAPAFLLGLISGCPVGTQAVISLYGSGSCSRAEAERLLTFCNNCGPAFVLGTVGISIWGAPSVGILLFLVQILASVTVGAIFGRLLKEPKSKSPRAAGQKHPVIKTKPFFAVFADAVKNAAVSIINICAFIVFFTVVIRLLGSANIIFSLMPALAKIGFDKTFCSRVMNGFFEVSAGVRAASMGGGTVISRLTLTGAILGWAGLSVHCQVLSFLINSDISPRPYICAKFLQTVISAFLTYMTVKLWPFEITASAALDKAISAAGYISFGGMLMLSVSTVLFITSLIPIFAILSKRRS